VDSRSRTLPRVRVRAAHPGAVQPERAGHQAPAGAVGIDTDEERSAPEAEAVEPVEAEAAEPVDAEPGKPGPTPSGAAPSADMADAGMAHTDVADADMAAADTRRGAGRGNRQRERRARGKCDHRFTQHCFLLMRTPSGRPPLTRGSIPPGPARAPPVWLEHADGAHLAPFAINFSGEVSGAIKQSRAARVHKQTFIKENEHSSKRINIHRGCAPCWGANEAQKSPAPAGARLALRATAADVRALAGWR